MTQRTAAALHRLFEPHLPLFTAEHQAGFKELLRLAEIGERALTFIASSSTSTDSKKSQAPAKKTPGAGQETKKKPRGRPKAAKAGVSKKKPSTTSNQASAGSTDQRPTLRELILRVLTDAKRPLPLSEIESAVKAAGHETKSAAFSKVVSLVVGKMKTELKRVGRGVYTLA